MKPNKVLHLLLLINVLSAIAGCTSINKQLGEPVGSSPEILAAGDVHYHQVLDELGPPTQITALPAGFAFLYENLQIAELQFGISSNADFFGWFKLSLGDADVNHQLTVITFDPDGRVQAYSSKTVDEKIGSGVSYQFLIALAPVVDTGHLDETPVQHDWGFSLLQPLPVALNRGQDIDLGAHGFEQRGTPTAIGQKALEFQ